MVEDVFQQVDALMASKERTMEIVEEVLMVVDGL